MEGLRGKKDILTDKTISAYLPDCQFSCFAGNDFTDEIEKVLSCQCQFRHRTDGVNPCPPYEIDEIY